MPRFVILIFPLLFFNLLKLIIYPFQLFFKVLLFVLQATLARRVLVIKLGLAILTAIAVSTVHRYHLPSGIHI